MEAIEYLRNPATNKGTAFTEQERSMLGLKGLLPPVVEGLERQVQRVMHHLSLKSNDLERYIYLIGLLDRNETLFSNVLMSDPAHFIPIVYAPTVGEACLKYSDIYRRNNGMYITIRDRGHVKELLGNWPEKDIRFICVSTGGRILGLGDLGANGMGIPLGKLQLYTACAGVPPEKLLPLLLDCGTDNEKLLNDPLYLGIHQKRPPTDELDSFVQEFVDAVQDLYPACCIHFEDWKGTDAIRLLARYRDKVCCYNDDIQGTAGAAGVPFDEVQIDGKTFTPGQANNFYLFPGVSLGIYAARPNFITDEMWIEGGRALAALLTPEQRERGMVFPPQSDILNISTKVAERVVEVAVERGLSQRESIRDIPALIRSLQYKPSYSVAD